MVTLTRREIQSVFAVSLIISLRLLGIFLILPVFSVFAMKYPGASFPLVGVAFGIYPLIQSFLQIPFGWASDRFGRRNLIILGLMLFSLGSFIAGGSDTINELIIARIIQGSGAVGAVAMAALGDYTRPEVRTQAFTITGIAIGTAFILGLIGGPIIAAHFGFSSLFYLLAALGLVAIGVAAVCLPGAKMTTTEGLKLTLRDLFTRGNIRRLYIAALVCSLVLNLFFFIYPLSWADAGLDSTKLWKVYIVVLLPSLLLVFPFVRKAEGTEKIKIVPIAGYLAMLFGVLVYIAASTPHWSLYVTAGLLFFGYTLYSAFLPSFLTQRVPQSSRGTALGFYNLASFLGASIGGMAAGYLYKMGQIYPLYFCLAILIVWSFFGLPKLRSSETSSDQK